MMKKALVTGAAGFIGSNLVDALLMRGISVTGVDNFSTGRREFIGKALENPHFKFLELDLLKSNVLLEALGSDTDIVFHLAANADVRSGLQHTYKDIEQNLIVTWNVLEQSRASGVREIAFSSTGVVYGEGQKTPTPENCSFPVQNSLYGASKIGAEGLVSAYAEGFGIRATIFRFVGVLGERYTHGHVYDFVKMLRENPNQLKVLGDGKQRKSYLDVSDCVSAMLTAVEAKGMKKVEIYNLGTDEYVELNQSIAIICKEMGLSPKLDYTGGDRGWVGDNPFVYLDCSKMRALGWSPKKNIAISVRSTVKFLQNNFWLFN